MPERLHRVSDRPDPLPGRLHPQSPAQVARGTGVEPSAPVSRFPSEARWVLGHLGEVLRGGPRRAPDAPPGLKVAAYSSWHRVQEFFTVDRGGQGGPPGAAAGALLDLAQVLDRLSAAGLPAVPLKGPLLGARLWGDPTLRVGHDLDVLVPPDQIHAAAAALGSLVTRLPVSDEYHHLGFRLPSGRRLELHDWPLGPRTGWRPRREDLWDRLEPRQDAGLRYLAFPPDVEIAVITVHAAHHLGYRLHWMLDVARMTGVHGEADWNRAMDLAGQWRVRRAFVTGATAAARLLDLPPHQSVMGALAAGAGADKVAAWIVSRTQGGAAAIPRHWERWPRWLALLESGPLRLTVPLSLLFRPTGADREMTRLPPWADGVTGLLRPALVVGRALQRGPFPAGPAAQAEARGGSQPASR